ncbi:MAG: hypothetical protein KAS98_05315, partial [Deltaproteobacteria bacterium]|nr:hypothetical protein [Deltaproteobacteria bacterium]
NMFEYFPLGDSAFLIKAGDDLSLNTHLKIKSIIGKIKDENIDVIGGLSFGADPIANAVALISYQKGKPVKSFSVRESIKDHGIIKKIEGNVKKGNRAVIIDDVITTGESTIKAITSAKDAGLEVVRVIALVDREEGGKEEILKHIKDFESIITRTRLMEAFKTRQLKKRTASV